VKPLSARPGAVDLRGGVGAAGVGGVPARLLGLLDVALRGAEVGRDRGEHLHGVVAQPHEVHRRRGGAAGGGEPTHSLRISSE
jgi:hypothetical protein